MDVVTVNVRASKTSELKRVGLVESLKAGEQLCLGCGFVIGNIAGSKDAVCDNCGYKDPCCE